MSEKCFVEGSTNHTVEPTSPSPRRILRKMPKQSSLTYASTQSPQQEVPSSPHTTNSSPSQRRRLSLDTLATTEAFEGVSLAGSPVSAASPRGKHYFSHNPTRPDTSQSRERGFQSINQAPSTNLLPSSVLPTYSTSRSSSTTSLGLPKGAEGLGIPGKLYLS